MLGDRGRFKPAKQVMKGRHHFGLNLGIIAIIPEGSFTHSLFRYGTRSVVPTITVTCKRNGPSIISRDEQRNGHKSTEDDGLGPGVGPAIIIIVSIINYQSEEAASPGEKTQ
jgi:hypothetical protein